MSARRPSLSLALGGCLLSLLLLPLFALALSSSPGALAASAASAPFSAALWLSLKTSGLSLAIVVLTGTPLAHWLAHTRGRGARGIETLVSLPVVIPPAVLGLSLLQAFGHAGLFGSALERVGLSVAFSPAAVVLAQVVVSAPFYVQAAENAFRGLDPELSVVARTLGETPRGAFLRVAVPIALPGLLAGAALCWARALGEFGATLLFAGNLPGVTQTLPLAIYTSLESDLDAAVAISLLLCAVGVCLLFVMRLAEGAEEGPP